MLNQVLKRLLWIFANSFFAAFLAVSAASATAWATPQDIDCEKTLAASGLTAPVPVDQASALKAVQELAHGFRNIELARAASQKSETRHRARPRAQKN